MSAPQIPEGNLSEKKEYNDPVKHDAASEEEEDEDST